MVRSNKWLLTTACLAVTGWVIAVGLTMALINSGERLANAKKMLRHGREKPERPTPPCSEIPRQITVRCLSLKGHALNAHQMPKRAA
ncbi:hypothetical protein ELM26_18275 [Escherichia coli]|nr:hypothetical protein [Escherichia coli]